MARLPAPGLDCGRFRFAYPASQGGMNSKAHHHDQHNNLGTAYVAPKPDGVT